MRLNHTYFWVTFTRPFTADWESLWLFEFPLCLGSFPQFIPLLGFVSFLQIGNGLLNFINVFSHNWSQHEYQHLIPNAQRWTSRILAFIPGKYDMIRTFKGRRMDGLSHSQLPKICLTSSIDFQRSMCSGSYTNEPCGSIFSNYKHFLNWGCSAGWGCCYYVFAFLCIWGQGILAYLSPQHLPLHCPMDSISYYPNQALPQVFEPNCPQ